LGADHKRRRTGGRLNRLPLEAGKLCANLCAIRAETPAHSAPSRAQNADEHGPHGLFRLPAQVLREGRAGVRAVGGEACLIAGFGSVIPPCGSANPLDLCAVSVRGQPSEAAGKGTTSPAGTLPRSAASIASRRSIALTRR